MNKYFRLVLLMVFVLVSVGCRPNYRDEFLKLAEKEGWSEKQRQVALQYSYRLEFSRETDQDSRVFEIVRGKLTNREVRKKLGNLREDFKDLLSYASEENTDFVDLFNLRPYLEQQEAVLIELHNRVRTVELKTEFDRITGVNTLCPSSRFSSNQPPMWYGPFFPGVPSWGSGSSFSSSSDDTPSPDAYSLKKLFPPKDFKTVYTFSLPQVDAARKDGTLRAVESAKLSLSRQYDRKEPDPTNPNDYPNSFMWRSSKRNIRVASFKIQEDDKEKPANNRVDYSEAYRVKDDGKDEKEPCLKVFILERGKTVVVVDLDKEGKPGFGLPDELIQSGDYWSQARYQNVKEVLNDESLLVRLFDEQITNPDRIPPAKKVMRVEITKADDPMEFWENAPTKEGWPAPTGYRSTSADNYNVRIGFKKVKKDSTNPTPSVTKEIEFFAKEWTTSESKYQAAPGSPTEYYYPKSRFQATNIVRATVVEYVDTKYVRIVFDDGSFDDGFVSPKGSMFIEDEPYQILYKKGDNWWIIKKSKDSKVFDKRRKASPPKESVGWYNNY